MTKEEVVSLAKGSEVEGTHIDFKSKIEWSNDGELLELIKDIIAIANSGGGCILIGINDDGTINNEFPNDIHAIDNSVIVNKIKKYTNIEFDGFEIESVDRNGNSVFCIIVHSSKRPIVFEKPGTYPHPSDPTKQKTAFGQGTLYFRHGAKSETSNNNDIIDYVDKELERIKDSWLGNIRKVVEAPVDHIVQVLPPNVIMKESPEATAIRITEDLNAPVYKIENPDDICPFRQKDVVSKINQNMKAMEKINQYDIQAIIHVHSIDTLKPNFYYKSLYGPKQYSQAFIDWIIANHQKNPLFFLKTREAFKNK
jgi:hypothetical protein